ncbi:LYR motif-containing protein 2-like [Oppia nitens]|uniref:LYR motif-containing protein 2-like n=1 Tax=Oppia nitens TaxID=1686743 RepID=UPI0023DBCFBA|nr:LYR motif-containing protein 2-like [Oppia nitens]
MGRRLSANTLTLSEFMLRQQVLSLYKSFMKQINRTDSQRELRDWIRQDFEANRHHTQPETIKMHLTRGRTVLKQLETTMLLSSAAAEK